MAHFHFSFFNLLQFVRFFGKSILGHFSFSRGCHRIGRVRISGKSLELQFVRPQRIAFPIFVQNLGSFILRYFSPSGGSHRGCACPNQLEIFGVSFIRPNKSTFPDSYFWVTCCKRKSNSFKFSTADGEILKRASVRFF